jgi:hypothetical protein
MWDGPIGFAANAALALALQRKGTACGLRGFSELNTWGEWHLPFLTDNAVVPTQLPGLGLAPASNRTEVKNRAVP